MSRYRVDLHVHTDASDGRSTLAEQAAAAKAVRLDAMAVTDHNRCTPVPERLSGVLLIPGCEISTAGGHMTALFLERPLDLAALGRLPAPEAAAEAVHRAGGLAVLAHPYEHGEPAAAALSAPLDGLETANGRADMKDKRANEKAAALAAHMGLPQVGGSDAHHAREVGNALTLIEAEALTLPALRRAAAAGACRAVLVRRTSHLQKGLARWQTARRQGGLLRMGKYTAYVLWCAALDVRDKLRRGS